VRFADPDYFQFVWLVIRLGKLDSRRRKRGHLPLSEVRAAGQIAPPTGYGDFALRSAEST
jgi:hypothetical protein